MATNIGGYFMVIRYILFSISCLCSCVLLMSANQHLQTTVNPENNHFNIKVLDEDIHINLDLPGVTFEKRVDGTFKKLFFHQVNHYYQIFFHEGKWLGSEQVAVIKQFRNYNGQLLLDGRCRSFSSSGQLLSESLWQRGKLHGKQKVFGSDGNLVEERDYREGLPVRCWSLYYSDGQLAGKMVFPDDLSCWMETESLPISPEKGLRGKAFYNPVTVIEQWFRPDGTMQQEKYYKVHKEGKSFVVHDGGYVANYDRSGNLTKEAKEIAGNSTKTQFFLNEGQNYKKMTQWVDGKIVSQKTTKR